MLSVPFQFATCNALLAKARILAPLPRSMIELDCNVSAPIPGRTDPAVYSLRPALAIDAVSDPFPFRVTPAVLLIRSIVLELLNNKEPPLFTVTCEVDPSAFAA